jgi:hypothetical protein
MEGLSKKKSAVIFRPGIPEALCPWFFNIESTRFYWRTDPGIRQKNRGSDAFPLVGALRKDLKSTFMFFPGVNPENCQGFPHPLKNFLPQKTGPGFFFHEIF